MSHEPLPDAALVDGSRVWRKAPQVELHWRDWGADSVVFEARSGQTLQFAPLAAAVMASFEEHACSFEDLSVTMAHDLGTTLDNELRSALTSIVEQFDRLGWIEPIEPP